jgi:FlaA1/EpsC-like NDP-sugar epimerase
MLVNRFRTLFIFLVDLALAAISLPLAILLRLGTDGFIAILPLVLQLSVLFTVIAAIVLARARLHRVAWRFISVNDAMLVATTSIVINLCFLALMFFWTRLNGVPRASVLINIFLLTTSAPVSRAAAASQATLGGARPTACPSWSGMSAISSWCFKPSGTTRSTPSCISPRSLSFRNP